MRKLFAMMLVVSLLSAGVGVQAAGRNDSLESLKSGELQAAKFTEDVADQKGKSGLQDYLIEFNTELELAAAGSSGIAAQGAAGKKAQGNAVVSALKKDAERVQQPFRQKLQRKGLDFESFFVVNMMRVKADHATIAQLAEDPSVKQVYLDRKIQLAPVDPEEAVDAIPGSIQWNISRIGADQLWNLGIDGRGVVVGIIDSGTDWTHPALRTRFRAFDPASPSVPDQSRLASSWFDAVNYINTPYDDNGHGTHVTGTIVGQTQDLALGVAPGAKWIAAKVLNADGAAAMSWILRAGEWMIAPGGDPFQAPDVINNSWGGDDLVDDWFRTMVGNWRAAGIIPVFAAGNQNPGEPLPWPGSIANPSHYPESFAVAATDISNNLGSFSKLGPSPYDDHLVKPDISAPGVAISSSIPGGGYAAYSGTSMAAPHIAGAAALLLSANPALTVDEVLYAVMQSAQPLTNAGYPTSPNMAFGYGLINARAAYDISRNGFAVSQVSGQILDELTGEAIIGAKLRLLQLSAREPAASGIDGSYALAGVPAGTYKLSLYHPKYGKKEQLVTLPAGSSTRDLTMRYPGKQTGQLTYDDSSVDDALVYTYGNNNGFAVVFKPQRYGLIRSISAYFYDLSFPPGSTGTEMDLVIYEADRYMNPTRNALTSPRRVNVTRGGWKEFDISADQLKTDKPFVAVFHQPYAREYSPAIGIDYNSVTGIKNSYTYGSSGQMTPIRELGYYGTFMVRARMDYAMESPVLKGARSHDTEQDTILKGGTYYTDGENILMDGTVPAQGPMGLLYRGDVVSVQQISAGAFALPIYGLTEGEGRIQAVLMDEGMPVLASNAIRLVRDLTAPEIQLEAADSFAVDTRMVTLTGYVRDASPVDLTINGRTAAVEPDGRFVFELKLDEGSNTVTLAAMDIMGQTGEKTIEIQCTPARGDVARLSGSNRYATAVEVSRSSYDSASTAILVTGLDYPDALASGPLAYAVGGPILLTGPAALNTRTAEELTRLGVSQVIILGGPAVISETVAETLRAMGITPTRIAGSNRYWTAAAAAGRMLEDDPAIDHVTLTSGESFADALAAGSAAARNGSPILLTRGDQLSAAALDFIENNVVRSVDIIGGTSVISGGIEAQLVAIGLEVQRYGGSNRFGTSVEIARAKYPDSSEAVFVNGMDFPDALAAAPYAAKINAPVILLRKDAISSAVTAYLPDSSLDFGTIVGGEAVVDNAVRATLRGLLEQ